MITRTKEIALVLASVSLLSALSGCGTARGDATEGAPPPAVVLPAPNPSHVTVDHPEQFPLSAAKEMASSSLLVVTGTVAPDVDRSVPVISLATGRVVSINARLGDTVTKGQLLFSVRSTDVSGAFSDYRKAVTDELLTRKQFDRAKDLYEHGAIALADLENAQDGEDDAKVTLETTAEHLRLLGSDPDKPNGIVDVFAPVGGVITDQEITNAAGVQALGTNPFTISDLSQVWVICDVHENDLPAVRVGDSAEIRLNAYPDRMFPGRISNIGSILDPTIRTAKVRIEVANPGIMRLGMFVTAKFHGLKQEMHAQIPAAAILHLHDRDWVYVPVGTGAFRRVEVVAGEMLADNMQEVVSGVTPGTQVVANALVLQNTIEQQ
jgi:membrane fusion protein, heavy metal efflux system